MNVKIRISMKKYLYIIIVISILPIHSIAITKKALFIGNSLFSSAHIAQTHVKAFATAAGDTLVQSLAIHTGVGVMEYWADYSSTTTPATAFHTNIYNGIRQGNLDYVVINESSSGFIETDATVQTQTYPYATLFENEIRQFNPGAETMYYMTWGMEAGYYQLSYLNQGFTTSTMSKKVEAGYIEMARQNNATNAPIGVVLRLLYEKAPYNSYRVLYTDGKHPSEIAAYAAAATLYTSMFRKDPTVVNYLPTDFRDTCIAKGLNPVVIAADILQTVKNVVLNPDSLLKWKIGTYDPVANFSSNIAAGNLVTFTNQTTNGVSYVWDFGDGTTSSAVNPTHTYTTSGSYNVTLTSTGYARFKNTISQQINTSNLSPLTATTSVSESELKGFNYKHTKGPSDEMSFIVSGTTLTDNIIITPNVNFEISTISGSAFASSPINLAKNGASAVAATTIYVRLKSGLAVSNYNGNIIVSSTGTPDKSISLSAAVEINPPIVSAANLVGFNYNENEGPSAEQRFYIRGEELTGDIEITAPSNFEISTSTGNAFSPANTITISPVAGKVDITSIYVRMKAGLVIQNYAQSISISSQGSNNIDIALTGFVNVSTESSLIPTSKIKIISISGFLKVIGAEPGDLISVYNSTGQVIESKLSDGNETRFAVEGKGIFMVKVVEK
jgi:PKD repeat protein